jgi:hypothetical protein
MYRESKKIEFPKEYCIWFWNQQDQEPPRRKTPLSLSLGPDLNTGDSKCPAKLIYTWCETLWPNFETGTVDVVRKEIHTGILCTKFEYLPTSCSGGRRLCYAYCVLTLFCVLAAPWWWDFTKCGTSKKFVGQTLTAHHSLLQLNNLLILVAPPPPQLRNQAEVIYEILSERYDIYDRSCNTDLWRNKNHLVAEVLVSQAPLK